MLPNLLILAAASLIPFLLAFAWFHPKVFGGEHWAKMAGMDATLAAEPVKPLKLFFSLLLNFIIAFGLFTVTVHQYSILSLLGGESDLLTTGVGAAFMAEYGSNHLSFGHGVVHGIIATLFFVLPVLGYVVIFEKKSSKYFWVYLSYWLIALVLMGGVIGQWGAKAI